MGKRDAAPGDELAFVTRHMGEFFKLRNKPELIEQFYEPARPQPNDALKPQLSLFMDLENLHSRAV